MKRQTLIILCIPALILLFAATFIVATEYGNISGRIVDSQTNQPLIGATVLLVGTNRGAQTDVDGKFTIPRVPPGSYTLKITAVGYHSLEIKDVNVSSDLTAVINNALTPAPEELGDRIVVESERDVIDKFQTSNQSAITKGSVQRAPRKVNKEQVRSDANYGYTSCYAPPQVECKPRSPSGWNPPPAHGGTSIVNGEPFDAMFFKNYGTNPFVDTEDDHLSTFAIDVDDASYVMCRSYLERAAVPPQDAIRTEEFINRFDYKYSAPEEETFAVYMEGSPSQFGQNCMILKVGIKGKKISDRYRKPANLVFVVDVSGSMAREDRLELVKKALRLLVEQLNKNDQIGIVVYGSNGRVVLEPTTLHHKNRIVEAISSLRPEGATNCQEGIQLGFQMASRCFDARKTNRIILCSDGVANVGITNATDLLNEIKRYADKGITLSTIGFGMGNFNDVLMEQLGNMGNGYYAYVDNTEEARRVFADNLTGALEVIARDVKIQVDFNPKLVRSYRLMGYENRDVADDKFRDNTVDGGEIGSGHSVTALYEVKLNNESDSWFDKTFRNQDIGRIFIRYKNPQNSNVEEINCAIPSNTFKHRLAQCSPEFKLSLCAAEFAEIMRGSYWAKDSNIGDVLRLANEVFNETYDGEVRELIVLLTKAQQLQDEDAEIFSRN